VEYLESTACASDEIYDSLVDRFVALFTVVAADRVQFAAVLLNHFSEWAGSQSDIQIDHSADRPIALRHVSRGQDQGKRDDALHDRLSGHPGTHHLHRRIVDLAANNDRFLDRSVAGWRRDRLPDRSAFACARLRYSHGRTLGNGSGRDGKRHYHGVAGGVLHRAVAASHCRVRASGV
jgi:hypothetical protein